MTVVTNSSVGAVDQLLLRALRTVGHIKPWVEARDGRQPFNRLDWEGRGLKDNTIVWSACADAVHDGQEVLLDLLNNDFSF